MRFDQVQDVFDIIDNTAGTLEKISAAEAFRRYDWLDDAPVLNAAGNYQGMVISAQWRTVYVYSSSAADTVGNITVLLSIADEVIKSKSQITSILSSNDDPYVKAAKLSSQVSGVALRVLAKLGTGTVSGINWVLRNTRWVNIGYWLNEKQFMDTLATVDTFTTWLNTQVDVFYSGESVYYFTTLIAGR